MPALQRVVGGLIGALPGMTSILLLIGLVFYVSAVMAVNLYGKEFPELFGTLGASLYTLFTIMTLEGWTNDVVNPIMEKYPYAWLFFIPFIVLLFVAAKKSRPVFGTVAVISLVALWLERYLMIMPSISEAAGPQFGVPELGATALFLGLFLAMYALFARTWPMISPRLAEITLSRETHHLEIEHYDHEDHEKDFVHEKELE